MIFPTFLESLWLLSSGPLPAVHNYLKLCCATLRRAFQLTQPSRSGGLLRLPHMARKMQFFLSCDLNFFDSHLSFFYYFTDGKLRYGEIMWITPFHIANLEIWELRTHLLSLEFSSRRIFRFQSHFQGFTQYCFSLALTFKPFHCCQTLSPYLGFSSKVTLLSVWKFSGGSISPTGCQTLTHKGLAHDLFGLLL